MEKLKGLWAKLTDKLIIRYLMVGAVNTLFGQVVYALLVLLGNRIGVDYKFMDIVSWVVCISFNYFTYKIFAFKKPKFDFKELLRFMSVYVTSFLISYVLHIGATELLKWFTDYMSAKPLDAGKAAFYEFINKYAPIVTNLLLSVVTILISFFGHRKWSFKGDEEKEEITAEEEVK